MLRVTQAFCLTKGKYSATRTLPRNFSCRPPLQGGDKGGERDESTRLPITVGAAS